MRVTLLTSLPTVLYHFLLLALICNPGNAFTFKNTLSKHALTKSTSQNNYNNKNLVIHLRGGALNNSESSNIASVSTAPGNEVATLTAISIAKRYNNLLAVHPIVTKSVTSCIIFCLSDVAAQRLEKKDKFDMKRIICTTILGFFYGQGLHVWYGNMVRLFPSTSLSSSITKSVLGQLVFGPLFIVAFFTSALLQANSLTFQNWLQTLKSDFYSVWLAGLAFWPCMDIICYSFLPVRLIPLFMNGASFGYTIYLSLMSNRMKKTS